MNFYKARNDLGKRKRFSRGVIVGEFESTLTRCSECGITWSMPGFGRWFNDMTYNLRIYMDRDHHPDFSGVSGYPIVSTAAKTMLAETFSNAVDFCDIEMVPAESLPEELKKEIRTRNGSRELKNISNTPPQYHRLLLKHGIEADYQKSNIELAVDCAMCGFKRYVTTGSSYIRDEPMYLIESTWKGYGVFNVECRGNHLFCTEKFVETYKQNKLTGLEFEQVQLV